MARKSKGRMASEAAALLAKLRAKSLTPERRREIAGLGGKARMAKLTQAEQRAIQSKGGKNAAKKRTEKVKAREKGKLQ